MDDRATIAANAIARVAAIIARYREQVIAGMRHALDRPDAQHTRFMRYQLGWEDPDGVPTNGVAGKMLRPALCMLCCESAGGARTRALPAAVAIELLHNFTLIHDDIEDESETRHGRPTLWRVAGVAQAINAGDGMFAIARRTLLGIEQQVGAEHALRAVRLLDDACVALCEGQYADLSFESRATVSEDEYLAMVTGKSAALVSASCAIGALAGGVEGAAVDAYARFGLSLGLAFQIQDDALGVWGSPNHTGKSAGDDIRARKKSFPIVHAMSHLGPGDRATLVLIYKHAPEDRDVAEVLALLDRAGSLAACTRAAEDHARSALEAIAELGMTPAHREDFEALAKFVVSRDA